MMTGNTPDTSVNEGDPNQDLDPVYHVLEEPMTTEETADSQSLNESNGNDGHDVGASDRTANHSGAPSDHVVSKVRRKPPSPPRKM
jgi:hypothetical protein